MTLKHFAALLLLAQAPLCAAQVTVGGSVESNIYIHDSDAPSFDGEVELEVKPRIFFAGEDKLDNGDSVIWKIWTGADNYRKDKDKVWGNREAWGGWQGDWGKLRFGRIYTPSYVDKLDWPYGNLGGSEHIGTIGLLGFNPDNSIRYDSPIMGGFSLSALYSLKSQSNETDVLGSEYFYDIAAGYKNGGWRLDFGYQENQALKASAQAAEPATQRMAYIASGYDFGEFTLKGGMKRWQNADSPTGYGDQNQYFVQGIYTKDKHTVGVTYTYYSNLTVDGDELDDSASQAIISQWSYALSKNTAGYIQARYASNETNGAIGVDGETHHLPGANSYRLLIGTWTGF
ncbi:porin [Jeongeupia wiesaeckerbachi]|uniref:porin n=1 Tax=Jeongeupia wiesaeckerbachi TaxID=3051218 RepID=UPI003D8033BB